MKPYITTTQTRDFQKADHFVSSNKEVNRNIDASRFNTQSVKQDNATVEESPIQEEPLVEKEIDNALPYMDTRTAAGKLMFPENCVLTYLKNKK